jgi:hypothetical protein
MRTRSTSRPDPPPDLATAIRRGARLGPQAFLTFFGDDRSSCALGAAAEACFPHIRLGIGSVQDLIYLYPVLLERGTTCPIDTCREPARTFWGTIAHLNDTHHWSRNQIAAYVHAVETK